MCNTVCSNDGSDILPPLPMNLKPVALSSADVPAELVAKERSVAEAKAAESGKPAEIVTKMVEGSIAKYLKEVSLMDQAFVKNDKQTIAQMLKENATTVSAFTMYIVGEGIDGLLGYLAR